MTKRKDNSKEDYISFPPSETLFLEKMDYNPNKMVLDLYVVKGKKGTPEMVNIGGTEIGPATPIHPDPSEQIRVRFYQPYLFQRMDESFATEHRHNKWPYVGDRLCHFIDSAYLRYYYEVSYGIEDDSVFHFCLICADDIVSVIASDPPEIEILKTKKRSDKRKKK